MVVRVSLVKGVGVHFARGGRSLALRFEIGKQRFGV